MLRAHHWPRVLSLAAIPVLAAGAGGALAKEAAHSAVNMRPGVTEIGHQIYDLHMFVLWACTAIGVVVFGVMFYSMFAHRKSRGVVPATFHESTTLEILWTIAPFVILIVLAVPATRTLTGQYDTAEADLDVLITGYQWKWKYAFPGKGVEYFSVLRTSQEEIHNFPDDYAANKVRPKGEHYLLEVDEPLVLPAGKKVRFLLTSADVIHAWWVPDLAVKKDAIPGFINEMWARTDQPGIYRGQCAELCGKDHGFMPIVVNVVPEAEFMTWLAERKAAADKDRELLAMNFTLDQQMERGKTVYDKTCASCHQPNGEGVPPAFPALKGSKIATGAVDAHMNMVLNGKQGTAMQAFGAQLNEVDLAAVITYERNAWGNNTGDIVQPVDVANFKKAAK
jgi:cytochrome c oxidase subunit 2